MPLVWVKCMVHFRHDIIYKAPESLLLYWRLFHLEEQFCSDSE